MDEVSLLNPDVWVDQYGYALFRFAYQRVRDADIAEDLVQETFLAAMRAKDRFKGHSTEKTWLYGILKHKIIDHFRRKKYDRSVMNIEDFAETTDKFFSDDGKWQIQPTSWDINPVEAYEQKEFMDTFYQCLSEMSQRLIVVSFHRKWRFFAIFVSIFGFPCAAYMSTPPRKPLISLTLRKITDFQIGNLLVPLQTFRMGTNKYPEERG